MYPPPFRWQRGFVCVCACACERERPQRRVAMTERQRDIDIQSRLLKLQTIVPDKNVLSGSKPRSLRTRGIEFIYRFGKKKLSKGDTDPSN